MKSLPLIVLSMSMITLVYVAEPFPEAAEPALVAQSTPIEKQPAKVEPAFPEGSVPRAAFTSGVKDREPMDNITRVGNKVRHIYYFTELRDLAGQKVTHRWEFKGQVRAEVKFEVGGSRWRVWSSKRLLPEWVGEWKVGVIDAAGKVLREDRFICIETEELCPDSVI